MSINDYAFIGGNYSSGNVERVPYEKRKSVSDVTMSMDETETDIDFMNRLYRNSDDSFFLGSWIVKPVIEILLHFMGSPKVTSKDKDLERLLADVYETRKSSFNQLLKELGLYGTEYAHVIFDNALELPNIRPRNKSFVMEVRHENFDNPDELTYIKLQDYGYAVVNEGQDDERDISIVFERTYWMEDNKDYKTALDSGKDTSKLEKVKYYYSLRRKEADKDWEYVIKKKPYPAKCIPIIEFHQNRLSADRTGYSDANGLIKVSGVYHQILEQTIDTLLYNGKPTLVFTGLKNSQTFVEEMYGQVDMESGSVMAQGTYDLFGSYYLEAESDVRYLQVEDVTANAESLLKLLFYIFVQVSGVPEWALGAHINGTWASTKMQSIPLIQKINSKRLDINDSLIRMNSAIAKVHEVNTNKKFKTYLTKIEWDEPLPEDRDYILSALGTIIPLDILTPETVLRLLDIVSDPDNEIKKAKANKKDLMDDDEKTSIIKTVKEKLASVKEGEEVEGEMAKLVELDVMLKTVFGEAYLEEMGLS